MAGGGTFHPKSSSQKPSSSSSHRKSRWEQPSPAAGAATTNSNPPPDTKPSKPGPNNSKQNPSPKPKTGPSPKPSIATPPIAVPPFQFPDLGPPPPPSYGYHMLERRTITLADGTVRSYFALPPDYQDFPPRPMPHLHRFGPNPDFYEGQMHAQSQNASLKRKFEEDFKHGNHINHPNGIYPDFRGEFAAGTSSPFRRRDAVGEESRAGKQMRVSGGGENSSGGVGGKHREVDEIALKKAFLHFAKMVNESEGERKRYLENGKQGRIRCLACSTGRSSKDFPDMHSLIIHAYNSNDADHLGLHKALCVLMGWNYSKPPDITKAYQFLPADEAAANQEDLIIWPPTVIIHNTVTGKGKDGRIEGLGNKAMDSRLRDIGFATGKSKSLYNREGHMGVTIYKFNGDASGLKEAQRLDEYFEKDKRGRNAWGRIQHLGLGKDEEIHPNLVNVDRNGEKTRVLYGYLGRVADLYKLDFETRKKVTIESQREYSGSK
ncbi:hypothetical protein Tsubulata_040007 [Turnera subulata]|uniref:XS domain-containing protein n=1 Tax=Turnera subulata TaxID=218843 RepID=A0A9Q0FMY2_9ROSI|nr:hypothetical protein Tsubulata_040007 [Turnera subulata]